MQLEFTAEQEDLRASVRSVLEKECPPAVVRSGEWEPLWKQMVALDWPALAVGEEYGGLGMTFVELAVVLEELGRVAAPGPFLATTTQLAPALRSAAANGSAEAADLLARLAAGELAGALLADDGYVMAGGVVARIDEGELAVAAVESDTPTADLQSAATLDAGRPLVHPPTGTEWRAMGPLDEAQVRDEAAAGVALELVGTCQAIFDMTLDYAKAREQFGVPIGSFQAVKHKLVDMYVALSRARACAYFAAATIAEDDPRRSLAVAMAKAAAGDAQRLIVQDGIQLHGGIGYTWEHDLHLFAKRAIAAAAMFGSGAHHRRRVAQLVGF